HLASRALIDRRYRLRLTSFVSRRRWRVRLLLRIVCRADLVRHDVSAFVPFGQRVRYVTRRSSWLTSHVAPQLRLSTSLWLGRMTRLTSPASRPSGRRPHCEPFHQLP